MYKSDVSSQLFPWKIFDFKNTQNFATPATTGSGYECKRQVSLLCWLCLAFLVINGKDKGFRLSCDTSLFESAELVLHHISSVGQLFPSYFPSFSSPHMCQRWIHNNLNCFVPYTCCILIKKQNHWLNEFRPVILNWFVVGTYNPLTLTIDDVNNNFIC